jgi:hypothetical protein
MPLITVIIVLCVVGLVLWLVNTQIPMPAWLKTTINVVAIVCVGIWLLQAFGLVGDLSAVKVPRLR